MGIKEEAKKMKLAAPRLAASSIEKRNAALAAIADALLNHKEDVFAANKKDMTSAVEEDISPAIRKRLKFDEGKMKDSIEGLKGLIALPDPLGKVTLNRELDDDLVLKRIGVPIGVIGVIFEARPDAMIQVASLCIKSGNCAILKGGSETKESNRVIFSIIKDAIKTAGLPEESLYQAEQRSEISELLECDEYVDLLIPRGSNSFVRYIMENTKIPVMGHSAGICHIYVDKEADFELAKKVIIDAKTNYPAACNAVETILVSEDIKESFLPELTAALGDAHVEMKENAYGVEYGDLTVSVLTVKDVEEAVTHINTYGSHHTDCIITKNDETADYFETMVDSAGVYRNCSTRFADGFRYGFGAEVGISTGKLHARGPVGLDGLLTYKYILEGNGNIVSDYASGKRSFTHKDI